MDGKTAVANRNPGTRLFSLFPSFFSRLQLAQIGPLYLTHHSWSSNNPSTAVLLVVIENMNSLSLIALSFYSYMPFFISYLSCPSFCAFFRMDGGSGWGGVKNRHICNISRHANCWGKLKTNLLHECFVHWSLQIVRIQDSFKMVSLMGPEWEWGRVRLLNFSMNTILRSPNIFVKPVLLSNHILLFSSPCISSPLCLILLPLLFLHLFLPLCSFSPSLLDPPP